jgi:hypothetical protein
LGQNLTALPSIEEFKFPNKKLEQLKNKIRSEDDLLFNPFINKPPQGYISEQEISDDQIRQIYTLIEPEIFF